MRSNAGAIPGKQEQHARHGREGATSHRLLCAARCGWLPALPPPPASLFLPCPLPQAIFSLHRGAEAEAEQRLASAKKAAEELLPLIKDNPTLRPGSYSNASERLQGQCSAV